MNIQLSVICIEVELNVGVFGNDRCKKSNMELKQDRAKNRALWNTKQQCPCIGKDCANLDTLETISKVRLKPSEDTCSLTPSLFIVAA